MCFASLVVAEAAALPARMQGKWKRKFWIAFNTNKTATESSLFAISKAHPEAYEWQDGAIDSQIIMLRHRPSYATKSSLAKRRWVEPFRIDGSIGHFSTGVALLALIAPGLSKLCPIVGLLKICASKLCASLGLQCSALQLPVCVCNMHLEHSHFAHCET